MKESYVRGYYYIDALGYSGFSELSRLGSDEIDALVESIDANIAFNFVNDLSEQMRFKLGSKYKQPLAQEPELSFQKRKFPKDTVFFPLQLESDTVSFFQRFEITSAIFRVLFNVNEYQVVVKFHPLSRHDTRFYVILFASFLFKRLTIYKGSIFDLLRDKVTVVTGNSGVGFEALFFGCPVITCSMSDYEYATISAKSCVDVIEALERGHRVPQEKIYKFLYFYLNRYCFSSSSDISGSTFAFPRFLAKKDLIEANHTVPFMEAFVRSQDSHRGDFKLYMRSILLNFLLFFREWFRK